LHRAALLLLLVLLFAFKRNRAKICKDLQWDELIEYVQALRSTLLEKLLQIGTTGIYTMEKALS